MAELRGEERWARDVIARTLGVVVVQHDDNSVPSMYDLRVGPADAPLIAIEVTAAVDGEFAATWNTGPANGPKYWQLQRSWIVDLRPGARIRSLNDELPTILASLEATETFELDVEEDYRRNRPRVVDVLDSLGVAHAFAGNSTPGRVDFTMTSRGGAIDSVGESLPKWVSKWLGATEREDNLRKLAASNAEQCHVFIPVAFAGADWAVESYLTSWLGDRTLPQEPPDLPLPVTGVWLASTIAADGVWWNGEEWTPFSAKPS